MFMYRYLYAAYFLIHLINDIIHIKYYMYIYHIIKMFTGVKFEQQCKLYVHAVKPCYLKLNYHETSTCSWFEIPFNQHTYVGVIKY